MADTRSDMRKTFATRGLGVAQRSWQQATTQHHRLATRANSSRNLNNDLIYRPGFIGALSRIARITSTATVAT